MKNFRPYLLFPGNCREAFKFYCSVFGGNIIHLRTYGELPDDTPVPFLKKRIDPNRIKQVTLQVDDGLMLMGSDTGDNDIFVTGQCNAVAVLLQAHSKEDAELKMNKLSNGGRIIFPFSRTFWGKNVGMLMDKFKIHWMIEFEE